MNNKNERCGENFFLGLFVYAVIIFAANWMLNILTKIVIIFTPAKTLAELKEAPGFLFNVTYPFLTFFVLILYFAIIFGAFFFASYKFAYKYDSVQLKKNIFLQMIVLFVVISLYSIYNSVVNANYSLVYWYSGAFWSGLFGLVDKADAINQIAKFDFSSDLYIISSITPKIGGMIILSELLSSIGAYFIAFKARKLGADLGIKKRLELREELFKNSPNYSK